MKNRIAVVSLVAVAAAFTLPAGAQQTPTGQTVSHGEIVRTASSGPSDNAVAAKPHAHAKAKPHKASKKHSVHHKAKPKMAHPTPEQTGTGA